MNGTYRRQGLVAGLVAIGVLGAGCGVTVESLPLPKPGVAGPSYTLHAVFGSVLNLPDHAQVKVGGSNVGVVTDISARNFQAHVTMQISDDVTLPAASTAELRQATPLGDMFVALNEPASTPGSRVLRNGDTLGSNQTSAGASVEELLVSLSMLFNGGGIAQLATIAGELDSIVGGRGGQVADLLKELTDVVGGLHNNSNRIDTVLAEFNTTFATLRQHKAELGAAADSLPGLLGTLADNNRRIGTLLNKVSVTSAALGDYARVSQDQLAGLVASTTQLMSAIGRTGGTLGAALDQLHASYPKILATMRGNTLTVATKLDYLSIGALYDSGSRLLPGIGDFNDLIGSLADVLRHIYGRVSSPSDPNYDGNNYPGVGPAPRHPGAPVAPGQL